MDALFALALILEKASVHSIHVLKLLLSVSAGFAMPGGDACAAAASPCIAEDHNGESSEDDTVPSLVYSDLSDVEEEQQGTAARQVSQNRTADNDMAGWTESEEDEEEDDYSEDLLYGVPTACAVTHRLQSMLHVICAVQRTWTCGPAYTLPYFCVFLGCGSAKACRLAEVSCSGVQVRVFSEVFGQVCTYVAASANAQGNAQP